ncbi:dirigent protein 10-like [Gracilinanus agilis]|uniref:dirigent protein 10-like n=1 Tax=Gracilinanus agilis TaxID=191870 RepID=UPI001CFDDA3C|nr:dirigent protein 10-like [Gracilinanus agilis]
MVSSTLTPLAYEDPGVSTPRAGLGPACLDSPANGLAPQGNGILGWFFSSAHMKGVPPGAGAAAGGGSPPGKAGYGTLPNGYGAGAPNGAGAGLQSPTGKAGYRNGLGAGTFPGAGAQPGLGGGMKPQKAGEACSFFPLFFCLFCLFSHRLTPLFQHLPIPTPFSNLPSWA